MTRTSKINPKCKYLKDLFEIQVQGNTKQEGKE